MKMETEHLNQMTKLLDDLMAEVDRSVPELVNIYEKAGKTAKAFRWDCLFATAPMERDLLVDDLYKYLEDSHIDTGLRHYFRSV